MFAADKQDSPPSRNTNKTTIELFLKKTLGGLSMKAINFLVTMALVLTFTACSNASDEFVDNQSFFDSIKDLYGVQAAALVIEETNVIPSVTVEEMRSVLETLRRGSDVRQDCKVESSNKGHFGSQNETAKKVVMTCEYNATGKAGTLLENFLICVELNFSIENTQAYYLGTDYSYSSNLFSWSANGLSLSPSKNADKYTYEFESQSFLYFKIKDQGNCLVRVPMVFRGNYNFNSEKGNYSFRLLKDAE